MQVRHAATRAYILTHLIILILSMCVTSANVDFMQLLLQLEQEKGEKQQLDWLVSEGKKQVQCHTPYMCALACFRAVTDMFAGVLTPLLRLQQGPRA